MSYSTSLIGYTGPAGRIGSGSAYHIDSKYASSLPWEEVDRRFQAKASRYAEDGRNIVFSNEGMNYATYDPAAPWNNALPYFRKQLVHTLNVQAGTHLITTLRLKEKMFGMKAQKEHLFT